MPRKGHIAKRDVLVDPIYNSKLVTRLINKIMIDGKKGVAQTILYNAFEIVEVKTGKAPMEVFEQALENVMPQLELKVRRVGGANYQVPVEVSDERRLTLGLRWIVNYARLRNEKTMEQRLAAEIIDASNLELEDSVVNIKRVTKVVKGGRNMRFAALVVVGDKNGHVGAGLGKAAEVPEAIRKAKEDAIKKLVKVDINENGSIPYDYTGKFGSASVLLKSSPEGTGIIAGGPARKVLELAGYKNIRTKSLGSNNKQNVVLATIEGLKAIKSPEEIAKLRGKSLDEILN